MHFQDSTIRFTWITTLSNLFCCTCSCTCVIMLICLQLHVLHFLSYSHSAYHVYGISALWEYDKKWNPSKCTSVIPHVRCVNATKWITQCNDSWVLMVETWILWQSHTFSREIGQEGRVSKNKWILQCHIYSVYRISALRFHISGINGKVCKWTRASICPDVAYDLSCSC